MEPNDVTNLYKSWILINAQPWGAIKAPPKDTTPLPTVAGSLQGSSWLGCTNSDKFTAAFLARIRNIKTF